MSANKSSFMWRRLVRLLLVTSGVLCPMSRAWSQAGNSSDLTVTVTNTIGNPTGADFAA